MTSPPHVTSCFSCTVPEHAYSHAKLQYYLVVMSMDYTEYCRHEIQYLPHQPHVREVLLPNEYHAEHVLFPRPDIFHSFEKGPLKGTDDVCSMRTGGKLMGWSSCTTSATRQHKRTRGCWPHLLQTCAGLDLTRRPHPQRTPIIQ